MKIALTHKVSPKIAQCELTFIERTPIDYELAVRQHSDYEALLSRLGVTVKSLSENEALPDACFVEDTAVVVDELAVICSMGASSRRPESSLLARELLNYRELAHISLPATIEGGDVLRIGKRIFVGQSKRTNGKGIEELIGILEPLGYRVTPVRVKGGLHLKSACSAIDDETLFVSPTWIDIDSLKTFKLLTAPHEEPASANVLRVGNAVCVQTGFPRALELIQGVTGNVITIDMSELRKAEAGLTCCSLIFEESEA